MKWLALFLLSLSLSLLVYPSAIFHSKDTLPDRNDARLLTYIIGQVQNNLIQKQPLYHGTFFAPEKDTLAYSDLFLTSSLITLPLRFFLDNPVQIFNLVIFLNLTLSLFFGIVFFYRLSSHTLLSVVGSVIFNLSGYHLSYFPHQQIFSFWLIFLAATIFLRYLDDNKPLTLISFLITATAQISESIFSFYLLFFITFIIFLENTRLSKIKTLLPFLIPFVLLWFTLLSPYLKLHLSFPEASRPIRDAAHFSLGLEETVTKYRSPFTLLFFLVSALLPFSLKKNLRLLPYRFLFFFGLIMSLGPVLKLFGQNLRLFHLPLPLPYSLFYYLFPGFTGFRTPSRFILLSLFALSALFVIKTLPYFKILKLKTQLLILTLVTFLLLFENQVPLPSYTVNINRHPVYEQVAKLPAAAVILELPIKLWNMPDHEIESVRSLYSLEHQHRRLGGFSGFATLDWINLVHEINNFGLTPEITAKLAQRGVTHLIQNNLLTPLSTLSADPSLHEDLR